MENYNRNNYCSSGNCNYSRDCSPVSLDYTPMKNQIGDYSNQGNIYTTI